MITVIWFFFHPCNHNDVVEKKSNDVFSAKPVAVEFFVFWMRNCVTAGIKKDLTKYFPFLSFATNKTLNVWILRFILCSKSYLDSSVIGNSILGKKLNKNIPFFGSPITTHTLEGFAFHSYKTVCGDGNEIGDGVVPCCAGYLDGAIQITLEGVQHSHTYPGPLLVWFI